MRGRHGDGAPAEVRAGAGHEQHLAGGVAGTRGGGVALLRAGRGDGLGAGVEPGGGGGGRGGLGDRRAAEADQPAAVGDRGLQPVAEDVDAADLLRPGQVVGAVDVDVVAAQVERLEVLAVRPSASWCVGDVRQGDGCAAPAARPVRKPSSRVSSRGVPVVPSRSSSAWSPSEPRSRARLGAGRGAAASRSTGCPGLVAGAPPGVEPAAGVGARVGVLLGPGPRLVLAGREGGGGGDAGDGGEHAGGERDGGAVTSMTQLHLEISPRWRDGPGGSRPGGHSSRKIALPQGAERKFSPEGTSEAKSERGQPVVGGAAGLRDVRVVPAQRHLARAPRLEPGRAPHRVVPVRRPDPVAAARTRPARPASGT